MSNLIKGTCLGIVAMFAAGFVSALLEDVVGDPHTVGVFFFAGGLSVYFYCRFISPCRARYEVKAIQRYPNDSKELLCPFEITLDEAMKFGGIGATYRLKQYQWTAIEPGVGGIGRCIVTLVPSSSHCEILEKAK